MTSAAPRRRTRGHVYLFRFLAGMHLDGRRRTDATFFARGTVAVEPHWWGRGRPSRWAMLPGWQRASVRLVGLVLVAAWWRDRTMAEWAAALILGPAAGIVAWRVVRGVQLGRHSRRVVRPLAAALAPAMESTPAEVERSLLVPRGARLADKAATIAAYLPPHHQGTAQQTDAAARIVGQRLGGEWQARVARDPLALLVTRRPEPPRRVEFASVADEIRARGSLLRPLMGIGASDDPVWLDFGNDVAHQGVSCGTGGGKSAYLRYLLAQFAYWGCADFPVLDSKGVSLAGMEPIPGLRVYRDAPAQWDLIAALRKDMEARYSALIADPGAAFPLCVLLCDEMNDAAIEWRAWWQSIKAPRDPATPPVYADLTRLMIKGRQVNYRVIGVYQRLSAAACGGIDAGVMRDSYGTKALSRFSPQAWDTLTGIRPRASSSVIPGRWTVVLGHDVRAVQVPYAEPAELVAFARSSPCPGVPVPPRVSDPRQGQPLFVPRDMRQAGGAAESATAAQDDPAAGLVVGLDAAAEALSMSYHGFRKARQRRPVPGEVEHQGRPAWPVAALAAWRGGVS